MKVTYDSKTQLHVLTISACNQDDNAEYTVKGNNEHGTMSATFNIIVHKEDKLKTTKTQSLEEEVVSVITKETRTEVKEVQQQVKISEPEVKVIDEKPRWRRRGKTVPSFEVVPQEDVVNLGDNIKLEVKLTGTKECLQNVPHISAAASIAIYSDIALKYSNILYACKNMHLACN